MKNEIGRKITSLTLMTIMLAGGMTIAFPGFTPDAYAANANLIVSAENTGGNVSGPQVIEILVIDDDLADTALPDVTVNGDTVVMTATNDGNWYAYIADNNAITELGTDNPGVNFGTAECAVENLDASDTHCGTDFNVVESQKTALASSPNQDNWPFVQSYAFPNTIEIQYNKAGGTQISTLEFDDNAAGLSLDRSIYPSGAQVHVTIEDHRLNIDPTSDDVWTWNTIGDVMYRGAAFTVADPPVPVDIAVASGVCADCMVDINFNRQVSEPDDTDAILELVTGLDDLVIRPTNLIAEPFIAEDTTADPVVVGQAAASQEIWFTVAEDGGPNTGIFTATDLDNNSLLKIVDDAARGSTASITYDGTETGIEVKFSEATIDIQSPDDVWTSGLAIPIVVVDGDVNKNSLDSDDVVLSDPNSIIPTLVTGDPFTLGELSGDLTTWVGWNITSGDSTDAIAILATIAGAATSEGFKYTGDENVDPFVIKGYIPDPNDATVYIDNTVTVDGDSVANTDDNIVVVKHDATVELFSERAILSFEDKIVDEKSRADDVGALIALATVAGNEAFLPADAMPDTQFTAIDFIVIDFENGIDELRNSLIDHSSAVGHNFVNYNVESFETDITSIEVLNGTHVVETIDDLGDQFGYVSAFSDETEMVFDRNQDNAEVLQLKLNFAAPVTVDPSKEYPIVVDFFSFGYENDGEASR